MTDWSIAVDKQDLAARFGKAAARYDRHAEVQKQIGEHLLTLIPTYQIYDFVLDLGCGTGFFLQKLQTLSRDLIGLDLSPGMLAEAASRHDKSRLICGDAEQLPFCSDGLDLVYSSLALQWCSSLRRALSELQRVIRPGGLLVFATLSAGSLDELRRAWRQVDELDHVNSFITEVALRDLCAESGFKEVRWECRRHVLYYESLNELLMGLKGIGANQVSGNKSTGLAGRQRWLQFQAAYEAERDYSGRLPVSYEVCYGVLMR